MKSLFSKYVWLQLILSILLLFGGSLIIAFAITGKQGVLRDGLNLVVAVTLFIFGLFAILTAFIFERNRLLTAGFLYGSACIALGVFLCAQKFFILEYIVLILSIFFIVIGTVILCKGIMILASRTNNAALGAAALVIGILCIVAGILSIIYDSKMVTVFCVLAGVLLAIAGVYELVMGIRALSRRNRNGGSSHRSSKKSNVKEIDYTK